MECCHKVKDRDESEKKALTNRLKRIEGQIRGLLKMVDENAYCIDILTQAQAANAALSAFEKELLTAHIRTCLVNDVRLGKDETVDELIQALGKMIKN